MQCSQTSEVGFYGTGGLGRRRLLVWIRFTLPGDRWERDLARYNDYTWSGASDTSLVLPMEGLTCSLTTNSCRFQVLSPMVSSIFTSQRSRYSLTVNPSASNTNPLSLLAMASVSLARTSFLFFRRRCASSRHQACPRCTDRPNACPCAGRSCPRPWSVVSSSFCPQK